MSNVQIQNPFAMSIADAGPIIRAALQHNMPILLQSMPGLGKTAQINTECKALGYDIEIDSPGTKDPSEYNGLFFPNDTRTAAITLPAALLHKMQKAKKPFVVYFDDLHLGMQAVQGPIANIINERRINDIIISPEVRFIAACNRKQDNAGANTLSTMLLSRFKTILEIKPDAAAWCSWAAANKMPAVLIAYIRMKPDMISTFNPTNKGVVNFACPRTIEALGKWINAGVYNRSVWAGCVGDSFAVDFGGFYDLYTQIGNLPLNITNGIAPTAQQQDMIDNKADVRFMICAALAQLATVKSLGNIAKFISTLPAEYENFFYTDAGARDVNIRSTKHYIDFVTRNQNVL